MSLPLEENMARFVRISIHILKVYGIYMYSLHKCTYVSRKVDAGSKLVAKNTLNIAYYGIS